MMTILGSINVVRTDKEDIFFVKGLTGYLKKGPGSPKSRKLFGSNTRSCDTFT